MINRDQLLQAIKNVSKQSKNVTRRWNAKRIAQAFPAEAVKPLKKHAALNFVLDEINRGKKSQSVFNENMQFQMLLGVIVQRKIKLGKVEQGLASYRSGVAYLNKSKEQDSNNTTPLLNYTLSALCHKGNSVDALQLIFDEQAIPNAFSFTQVLHMFVRQMRLGRKNSKMPTLVGNGKARNDAETASFIADMLFSNACDRVAPTRSLLHGVLAMLVGPAIPNRDKLVDQVLSRMASAGIVPNRSTFVALLRLPTLPSECERMLQRLDRSKQFSKLQLHKDELVATAMVQMLIRSGKAEDALQLLRQVHFVRVRDAAMIAFSQASRPELVRAVRQLPNLDSKSHMPSSRATMAYLCALKALGQPEEQFVSALKEAVRSHPSGMSRDLRRFLLREFAERRLDAEIHGVCTLYLRQPFAHVAGQEFVRAFVRSGNHDRALEIPSLLRRWGRQPTAELYDMLLRHCFNDKQDLLAAQDAVVAMVVNDGITPDASMIDTLTRMCKRMAANERNRPGLPLQLCGELSKVWWPTLDQDIPASYVCERMCRSAFTIMVDELTSDGEETAVEDHVDDAFDIATMVIDYWDPSALVVR